MNLRKFSLYILFTGFTSLASGQWDSDRFLFEPPESTTRPKAVKSIPTRKEKTPIAGSRVVQPAEAVHIETKVEEKPIDRQPANVFQSDVKLDVQAGFSDFNLKGLQTSEDIKKGSYSLGASLTYKNSPSTYMNLHYLVTPSLMIQDSTSSSEARSSRWEDLKMGYSQKVEGTFKDLWIGLVIRQTGWWNLSNSGGLGFQQINYLGLAGKTDLPSQGKWEPHLQFFWLPVLRNSQGNLSGSNLGVEWDTQIELQKGRSFLINLGYEKFEFNSRGSVDQSLTQTILKFYLGYRISGSKESSF